MARAKLDFQPFNYDDLPQSIKDHLAIIDEAKAAINAELAAVAPAGHKAQHSYKLDFTAGKRVFKIAFYRPAAAKVAPQQPQGVSLAQWAAQRAGDGRAV